MEKIYRINEVLTMLGVHRSTIYRYMAHGCFPRPIRLMPESSSSAIGWTESSLEKWLQSREGSSHD